MRKEFIMEQSTTDGNIKLEKCDLSARWLGKNCLGSQGYLWLVTLEKTRKEINPNPNMTCN